MKKLVALFLAICAMLSLSSCKEENTSQDKLRIITSFYPVYITTLNIVDGVESVELINMTEPDVGCLHDYIMTAEDIEKAVGAKLFIASGLNMEKFVGKVSLGIPRLELLESGEDIPHKIGEEEEENPHYWMNIENTIAQTEKIKRTLCRIDPVNADVYEKNAAEYTQKLNEVKLEAQERCASLGKRKIAVMHDSFDYFADEFGLEIIALVPDDDNIIAADKIERAGIDTIFTQQSFAENASLRTIVKKKGWNIAVLDTLTSGEINEDTKDAYLDAVHKNLDLLESVLNK
ncbi:MAG: zinc ABC transporter substrate-binding protein [Oscillospiraceae bacterium]|nr:zinc ABC transporter substrate-binding protein [Oscillospiraceae bacterium]